MDAHGIRKARNGVPVERCPDAYLVPTVRVIRKAPLNMNLPSYLAILAISITLSSCGGSEGPPDTTVPSDAATTVVQPGISTDAVQTQPGAAAVSDPNPPHGEPGHRCEIAVGASLSSAPAVEASMEGVPQTSPMFNTADAPVTLGSEQTTTAPGMNPPHGQPGHDCAVAVGSPLPN